MRKQVDGCQCAPSMLMFAEMAMAGKEDEVELSYAHAVDFRRRMRRKVTSMSLAQGRFFGGDAESIALSVQKTSEFMQSIDFETNNRCSRERINTCQGRVKYTTQYTRTKPEGNRLLGAELTESSSNGCCAISCLAGAKSLVGGVDREEYSVIIDVTSLPAIQRIRQDQNRRSQDLENVLSDRALLYLESTGELGGSLLLSQLDEEGGADSVFFYGGISCKLVRRKELSKCFMKWVPNIKTRVMASSSSTYTLWS